MQLQLSHHGQPHYVDTTKGHIVSISLAFDELGPNCFYAPLPSARPVRVGDFVGDTQQGGSVNFKTITLIPHGNGTHTECVGHISKEQVFISDVLQDSLHLCQVISVWPTLRDDGDQVIQIDHLPEIDPSCKAVLIRTMPNDRSKRTRQYSGTNPPYFDPAVLSHLRDVGVLHVLTDLPSVDREEDEGRLAGHKAWWDYPTSLDRHRTITELVFAGETIADGTYLVDIQISDMMMDASPSRIMLYDLKEAE